MCLGLRLPQNSPLTPSTSAEEAITRWSGPRARRAGSSCNAYYRNYASKETILAEYLNGLIEAVDRTLTAYDPLTQTRDAWLALLAAVRDVAPQYRLLLEAGYGGRIANALQRNMNRGPAADKTGPRYAARF